MKNDDDQLDLFQKPDLEQIRGKNKVEKKLVDPEPEFEVIPFPLVNRVKKIRTVARTYGARKTEEGKQRFWDQTVNQLGSQLNRFGITDAEIDKQIAAFRNAVSDEICRQAQTSQSKGNHS